MTEEEIAALQESVTTLTAQVASLTEERDGLKARPADAESKKALAKANREIAALKSANETLATEKATLEAKVTEATTTSVLRDAGVADADDQEYVLMKYGKLAVEEGEEKPSLADFLADAKVAKAPWLARMTKAKVEPVKAKVEPAVTPEQPAKVEPVVQPVTPATPVQPVTPSPDGAGNRTVVTTKVTGGTFSAADIAAMTPAQYKAHRALVRQQQGLPVPNGV